MVNTYVLEDGSYYGSRSGSMKKLCKVISSKIGIDEHDIMFRLPTILSYLNEKEEVIIRRYYLREDTASNIMEDIGMIDYEEFKTCLEAGINCIINNIK